MEKWVMFIYRICALILMLIGLYTIIISWDAWEFGLTGWLFIGIAILIDILLDNSNTAQVRG